MFFPAYRAPTDNDRQDPATLRVRVFTGRRRANDEAPNGVTHNASGHVKGLQSCRDEPRLGSMSTQDETGARPNLESKPVDVTPGDVDVTPGEMDR